MATAPAPALLALVLLVCCAGSVMGQDLCKAWEACKNVDRQTAVVTTVTPNTEAYNTVKVVDGTGFSEQWQFSKSSSSCTDTYSVTYPCNNGIVTPTVGTCTGNCGGAGCSQTGMAEVAAIAKTLGSIPLAKQGDNLSAPGLGLCTNAFVGNKVNSASGKLPMSGAYMLACSAVAAGATLLALA